MCAPARKAVRCSPARPMTRTPGACMSAWPTSALGTSRIKISMGAALGVKTGTLRQSFRRRPAGSPRWTARPGRCCGDTKPSQVLAGLVPTKSGLLFGGDTHGNLLVFNAKNGRLLKSIDTGGALNSGLISYSVDGVQYVAATAGGSTENPSTVAGPLRVVIYSLQGSDTPKVVTLPRL